MFCFLFHAHRTFLEIAILCYFLHPWHKIKHLGNLLNRSTLRAGGVSQAIPYHTIPMAYQEDVQISGPPFCVLILFFSLYSLFFFKFVSLLSPRSIEFAARVYLNRHNHLDQPPVYDRSGAHHHHHHQLSFFVPVCVLYFMILIWGRSVFFMRVEPIWTICRSTPPPPHAILCVFVHFGLMCVFFCCMLLRDHTSPSQYRLFSTPPQSSVFTPLLFSRPLVSKHYFLHDDVVAGRVGKKHLT